MMRIAKNSFEREAIERFNEGHLIVNDINDKELVEACCKLARNLCTMLGIKSYDIELKPEVTSDNKVQYHVVLTSSYYD